MRELLEQAVDGKTRVHFTSEELDALRTAGPAHQRRRWSAAWPAPPW